MRREASQSGTALLLAAPENLRAPIDLRAGDERAGHSEWESSVYVPTLPASVLCPVTPSVGTERQPVDALYAETAEIAWRTLHRLGVPTHALPDAVQDTLLVVHRRQADFRGDSSVRTWIFGIVLRVASSYHRKERRLGAVFQRNVGVALELAPSDAPSPFEQLEQRVASDLLQQLLQELPGELRDAFVLVELEELSIESAASTLGIRASTCKSRLRTARRLFEAAVCRERARRQRRPETE